MRSAASGGSMSGSRDPAWLAPLLLTTFLGLALAALVGGYRAARWLHARQGEAGPLALAAVGVVLAVSGGVAIRADLSGGARGEGFAFFALPLGVGLALAGAARWLMPQLQR